MMPYKRFLGFEKGEDNNPVIVESEAKIVRLIYRLYMEGMTASAISKRLRSLNILSPGGKKTWQTATVKSILTNEKYKGEALLQKKFTVDFLSKKIKVNEGEVPQYYVLNSHPAIIDPDEFDAVQVEIERRKKLGRPDTCHSPLSTKLVCGDCGGYFGSKVWNSNNDKYRRVIWQCNDKYKGNTKCTTPHVIEDEVKQKFVDAFNSILEYKDDLIVSCRMAQQVLCDDVGIGAKIEELEREIEVVNELSKKLIYANAHGSFDQDNFDRKQSGYEKRFKKATDQITELEKQKHEKEHKHLVLEGFIKNLIMKDTTLDSFDEPLWLAAIERVIVPTAGQLTFEFKDGTVISR